MANKKNKQRTKISTTLYFRPKVSSRTIILNQQTVLNLDTGHGQQRCNNPFNETKTIVSARDRTGGLPRVRRM